MKVFGPSVPVQGMVSDQDKAFVGPGQFQLLKNLRCDKGLPEARQTEALVLAKPSWATSAAPLGSLSVSLNGQQWEVAVWSDGSKARVAVASSDLGRWVEVTGTGQWTGTQSSTPGAPTGNNRLDSTTAHCQITVVRVGRQRARINQVIASPAVTTVTPEVDARDVVVISNGEDYPRIWDPGGAYKFGWNVTAIAGASGEIQLTTSISHHLQVGDHVYISGVGGTPSADGLWQVSAVGATTVRLEGSVFGSGYSNGIVTDRADLLVHKEVQDISSVGESFASVQTYWPIAGGASTTYYVAGLVNQARYQFSDSATAGTYNGANSVVQWDVTTTAAAGDIATVQFGGGLFSSGASLCTQLIMLVEGPSVISALKQCKIELNREAVAYNLIAVAWETLFDPTSSVSTQKDFVVIPENSAADRYWVIFDARELDPQSYLHLRFTRQGPAPGATQLNYILFIGATTDRDIPATATWGFNYEDALNLVEQRFHSMTARADNVSSLGGPKSVTTGTANEYTSAPTLPLSSSFIPSWRLVATELPSTTPSPVFGGLDGYPSGIPVYVKLPGSQDYLWAGVGQMWRLDATGGQRAWTILTSSPPVYEFSVSSGPIESDLDANRPAPSAYQQCMPKSAACEYFNHRLFCGAIKESSGNYSYGDYYYSWDRQPFRFQQVQENEFRGGYAQLGGERVMAFRFSASAALGSGRVFMFSDKWVYSLGESGPFTDAGLPSSEIGRPVRIAPHGTLSPRSPSVGRTSLIWVDQDAQVMQLSPGGLKNISRGLVGDRFEGSVSSRKANLSGTFWQDRFYFAFTPNGETLNERVLIFNEEMQAWESEDYETLAADFELLHAWTVTPGVVYASRLFFYSSTGSLYAYEEEPTGTVAIQWTTGAYNFDKWTSWYIEKAIMAATSQSATGTLSRISSKWGPSEPWATTISHNESGAVIATYMDSVAHTKTGTERTELDWEWYLDYTATVAPGTVIRRLEFEVKESNVNPGLGT